MTELVTPIAAYPGEERRLAVLPIDQWPAEQWPDGNIIDRRNTKVARRIPNSDVIPVIESALFDGHESARFAVGILAVNDIPLQGMNEAYAGYYDLRRNVYVDQTGQLSPEEIQEDGTDRDTDDARSVAFGVIENRGQDQRVVAALRLIIKGATGVESSVADRPLPVEEFCPDIFAKNPAPKNSLEVSRLIARHEKAALQKVAEWTIYAAGLSYVSQRGLGPTYAVIEPWLERHFKGNIPVTRMAEPRYIEHYNDFNLPIEVHTDEFVRVVEKKQPGRLESLRSQDGDLHFFGRIPGANPTSESAA